MSQVAVKKARISVEQLEPKIGALIHGVDLSQSLSRDVVEEIYQTLLNYGVIFFRDQTLSEEQHLDLGKLFGQLEIHPYSTANLPEHPEIIRLNNGPESMKAIANHWHSDVTWREIPSLGSILLAREVPDIGGDTLFANMEAAYYDLPNEIKEKLDGLIAIHDAPNFHERMRDKGASKEEVEAIKNQFPSVTHPVIRTHPDTGRKSIYVCWGFTQTIVGMVTEESDALLDYLYSRAAIPEYQVRFKWQKGSIAFWDNRTVQHYAVADYWPNCRVMDRVTIIGDKPV
jgi:taurine dioxygenase